jgi:hypothetical protein
MNTQERKTYDLWPEEGMRTRKPSCTQSRVPDGSGTSPLPLETEPGPVESQYGHPVS